MAARRSINILEGNTFVVCNEHGDIDPGSSDELQGLFMADTRYLSRWVLTIDGARPASLSVDARRYYEAQFFLAPSSGTTYIDSSMAVIRRRSVLDGFREWIEITNYCNEPLDCEIAIEFAVDFADLFEVKDGTADQKKGETYRLTTDDGTLRLGYRRDGFVRETWMRATPAPVVDDDHLRFRLHAEPQRNLHIEIELLAVSDPDDPPKRTTEQFDSPAHRVGLRAWHDATPRLSSDWVPFGRVYRTSLHDLASLRFEVPGHEGAVFAAGLPWFMCLFGRDSLITSYQALPFAPELAAHGLRTLAALQAHEADDFRDARPGKILHELRFGESVAFRERPQSPYFGSADATPLFLVLLDEYERWTGDAQLVCDLEDPARAALRWIDDFGDRDGDGYVEYERHNTEQGLENQCWKDSANAIQWADGRLASLPRATCEIQGYVYDAKMRCARLARAFWHDDAFAASLERHAAQLKAQFNRDFWMADRGYFALALDGEKRPVDALASNIGQLLWSGIVDEDKAGAVVEQLMGDRLFSGWGIRTFATGQASYNPIGYHLGTVWPHDTSLIVAGLRRYGYRDEAARLAFALLEAARVRGGRLPEAFAGFARRLTSFPVEYPTACSPQAWASGAPLLLVRALLGLEPRGDELHADPYLPAQIRHLALENVPGRWGRRSVSAGFRNPA